VFPEKTQEDRKRFEQVEHGGGEEVDMADMSRDIFVVDEEKFPPGNYYNVKAGRQVMRERAPDNGRRKECGFDLIDDDRVQGAVMRYQMNY
jgi:hypothetical protein